MSDYNKKIHPREHDPYENISVNPIEKNKKDKEEFPKNSQDRSSKLQIFATLISCFKKIATFFGFKDRENFFLPDQYQLFEHLTAFRSQLLILMQEDESHNPEFTQQLSELWHNLVDDCNSVSASLQNSSKTINNIEFFISQISHYPYGADHTLGYYFEAFAGKDWIPFPFMDMLKELYEEHQKKPSESLLSKWVFLLDAILSKDSPLV